MLLTLGNRLMVLCGLSILLTGCTVDFGGSDVVAVCGDGVIEAGEDCDGTNLGGQDCASLGFNAGTLFCSACAFNAQSCYLCGNGLVEPGENCDDGNLIDDRSCSADCQRFCGDGVLDPDLGEACDQQDLGGANCADFGFHGQSEWEGLTCDASCLMDTSYCVADCWDHDDDGYGTGLDCLGPDCTEMDDLCWQVGDLCCPPNAGMVGAPCEVDGHCNGITDGTPTCMLSLMQSMDFPGGYCTGDSCTPGNSCDADAGLCVDVMGVMQFCLKPCVDDTACRVAEGYTCDTIDASAVDSYCLPPDIP